MRDIVSPLDGFLSPFGVVRGAWSPSTLFASGEAGAWYEPSPTNCFQLSNGTTAAGVGDPVGYLTDLSGNGNHATQSTAAARPTLQATYDGTGTLGSELVTNGTFDSDTTGWTNPNPSRGTISWESGRLRITNDGVDNYPYATQTITTEVGKIYLLSFELFMGTATTARVLLPPTPTAQNYTSNQTVTHQFTATSTSHDITFYCYETGSGGQYVEFDNISVREVPEASRRYYLEFDGVDDALATSVIDFSASDKIFYSAAVEKTADSNFQPFFEFGNTSTTDGSFSLSFAGSTNDAMGHQQRGTISGTVADYVVSPIDDTYILSGLGDISEDQKLLRVNGVQEASSGADQGTGNFGNNSLYIGSREGSSFYLEGNIYSIVIRSGASTTAEIESTESYLASSPAISGVPTIS